MIETVRVARLCNTAPWIIDALPAEVVAPYTDLLHAIDQANSEIATENESRVKAKKAALLRRITLAD